MKRDDRPKTVGEHVHLVAPVLLCSCHLRLKAFENLERGTFARDDRPHVVRDVSDHGIQ